MDHRSYFQASTPYPAAFTCRRRPYLITRVIMSTLSLHGEVDAPGPVPNDTEEKAPSRRHKCVWMMMVMAATPANSSSNNRDNMVMMKMKHSNHTKSTGRSTTGTLQILITLHFRSSFRSVHRGRRDEKLILSVVEFQFKTKLNYRPNYVPPCRIYARVVLVTLCAPANGAPQTTTDVSNLKRPIGFQAAIPLHIIVIKFYTDRAEEQRQQRLQSSPVPCPFMA